jgi:nuclear GTP-binding protein
VATKHITDIFGINHWTDSEDFINQVAIKTGKLLKGGEPDSNNVCKTILFNWQRGKIPYFEKPPQVNRDVPQKTIQQIMEMAPIDAGTDANNNA